MSARLAAALLALAACAPGASTATTTAPAATRAIVLPPQPPDSIAPFVGAYVVYSDTVLIYEDGGRLFSLGPDSAYTPLLVRDGGARLAVVSRTPTDIFRTTRDASGRVTELTTIIGAPANVARYVRYGAEDGTPFRIVPRRPVAELRELARTATPPAQPDSLLAPDLVEIVSLDPTIRLDVRYATEDNFMGARFYDAPRAFLQRPAAEALVRAHRRLAALGLGIVVHDAYRPWYVTWMFWEATPEHQREFVADPASGSRHNRGAAVDIGLYDLATGEALVMPSGYDEFSRRAHSAYPGGTARQRALRDILRRAMEAEGFAVYAPEWWHFDHGAWRRYPVLNRTFDTP